MIRPPILNTQQSVVNNWSDDVATILDNIRTNCVVLSKYHKKRYLKSQASLKYFRIPIIVISAVSSCFSIGLQSYINQEIISMMVAGMSLSIGILGSLELYLNIQKRMELDLSNTKELYIMAIDIQKTLSLTPDNRNGDGLTYLEGKFSEYCQMCETSNVIEKSVVDKLTIIDVKGMQPISRFPTPLQSTFNSPLPSVFGNSPRPSRGNSKSNNSSDNDIIGNMV